MSPSVSPTEDGESAVWYFGDNKKLQADDLGELLLVAKHELSTEQ